MATESEKAILAAIDFEADEVELDDLERSLQAELEEKIEDLDFLKEEREHINNPDYLGETVMNVVWEQFMNQVAATAGADFIKENGGMTLDLRDEAHIQTTENFAEGKIATHNTRIDYQKRYDDWQSNFQKDPNVKHDKSNYRYNDDQQVWEKHDTRSDSWKKVLQADARKDFDAGRPSGTNTNNTQMDHVISAAEIIRDPAANAHMTREEQINFANSEKNLNLMDSAANQSKQDSTMDEWLNSERGGKKPTERFDIDEEQLKNKDKEARQEYEKKKEEGERRSIEAGKQSQKEEAFRIGGKALRTALMTLLAALVKEIIGKLVLWLKSASKSIKTLVEYIKQAIKSFVGKLKNLLTSTSESVITTIATSIVGPVVGTIKKVITLLKQGWKSIKEAIQFLRKPENRGKPLRYLLPQVGIIVITGLSGIGAIVLGEFIEKALMGIPFLAVDIPLLGSPANLIGMLMGAIVCGVIGAIAINFINKLVAKQQKNDNLDAQIDKKNEILQIQDKLIDVKIEKTINTKERAAQSMMETHQQAKEIISEAMATIFHEDEVEDNTDRLDSTANELAMLLE